MTATPPPFWRVKTLREMSEAEWESLCDGCGKCCLYKLEDEDTQEIFFTDVACRLLDIKRCRCTRYDRRASLMPDCVSLRHDFAQWHWMPATCAYRLLAQGGELPDWHPLVSGDSRSVHTARVSIRHFAVSEAEDIVLEERVIEWLE